jgi:branched-subunit amino acid aminotransferase/4-amino-4-deoxychorismate lyase
LTSLDVPLLVFVVEKELITPSLDSGLILPGVTRRSLLELARKWVGSEFLLVFLLQN